MPGLSFEHVSFHYETPYTQVFEGLSMRLDTRWRTGLVGRNGKGKSTLLGLIEGHLKPSGGEVRVPSGIMSFPYTPKDPRRPVMEVVMDSVAPFRRWEAEMARLLEEASEAAMLAYGDLLERYEAMGGYDIEARIERELVSLGMSPELLRRDFDTLSGGEQTRVLIVALFLRPDTFPLIDEPTNHLDQEGRQRLGRYLAGKKGFLLVSHDRHFLDLCVDHVLSLNKGDVRLNQGDFSTWKAQMDRELAEEEKRNERLKREIKVLEAAARKRRAWSVSKESQKYGGLCDTGYIGHQAAKLMRRARAIERRADNKLAEKKSLLKNAESQARLKLKVEARSPDRVLNVQNITLSRGGRALLKDFSMSVCKGERVALVGPNGCGKTSLLKAIVGDLSPSAGVIDLPRHLPWSRATQVPRWREGFLRDWLREEAIEERLFRGILGAMGVCGEIFERDLATFSQGERKKVDLCRAFLNPSALLIWDEPLNYIDLMSRAQVEAVVLDHAPTLLFVEHDRVFIDRIATRVIDLGDFV